MNQNAHGHSHDGHSHDGHDHSGHGHSHDFSDINRTRLGWAALLTGGFMLVEVGGGLMSGSLALLADAGHMFTDFAALSLAWFAARLMQRPADWQRTYGFDRFSVLVAFVNGLSLFVIAGWILIEAVQRILSPHDVTGSLMMGVAVVGLVVNIVAFLILHGADRNNLNVRGAALHVLGDLLGSVAAIVAAGIIMLTNWTLADPILSVVVAALILRSGWVVVRDAGHILLEAAPTDMDSRDVAADLVANVTGLREVHHVHVWSISQERKMMTLHACLGDNADLEPSVMVAAIKARVNEAFGIGHVTVEIERDTCADDGHHHA